MTHRCERGGTAPWRTDFIDRSCHLALARCRPDLDRVLEPAGTVVVVTLLAPLARINRGKAFLIASVTALLAFVPLTRAIVQVMDLSR